MSGVKIKNVQRRKLLGKFVEIKVVSIINLINLVAIISIGVVWVVVMLNLRGYTDGPSHGSLFFFSRYLRVGEASLPDEVGEHSPQAYLDLV